MLKKLAYTIATTIYATNSLAVYIPAVEQCSSYSGSAKYFYTESQDAATDIPGWTWEIEGATYTQNSALPDLPSVAWKRGNYVELDKFEVDEFEVVVYAVKMTVTSTFSRANAPIFSDYMLCKAKQYVGLDPES